MPKSPNQKLKLLYLAQILESESDEGHPLTVGQLIEALSARGIAAERKSVYDDIEQLCLFGMDIITVRGRSNAYYLGGRTFELPELKLLIDAVQSAKFITADKSRELIRKICTLTSRHEGGLMQRQVQLHGRAKTVNKRTYYNVDALHAAIAENRQVCFGYRKWAVDPAAPRMLAAKPHRGGKRYQVSPFALVWDDEYYYLVAYDAESDTLKHYRVDRMEAIAIANEARLGQESYSKKDISAYSKSVFGMFGGSEEAVRIRFANQLIGVVVDRFGTDILISQSGNDHFEVTVKAVVSPQFFSWVLGFGAEAQLLGPAHVVAQLRAQLTATAAQYG